MAAELPSVFPALDPAQRLFLEVRHVCPSVCMYVWFKTSPLSDVCVCVRVHVYVCVRMIEGTFKEL